MSVVLQDQFKTAAFIEAINTELIRDYHAPADAPFVTRQYVEKKAHYLNTDPRGLKELTHLKRPLDPDFLTTAFAWYRIGEAHINLSSPEQADALTAIAIAKWIAQSGGNQIKRNKSFNYTPAVLANRLNYLLRGWGIDPEQLWQFKPHPKK